MKIIIISGMSGAGKSRAADILEDVGYFCVDNMPVELLAKFAEFCIAGGSRYERVALVTDIRSGSGLDALLEAVDGIKAMGCECKIIYLDSDTQAIIRRYKETRRPHPFAHESENLVVTVERERDKLKFVKERADVVMDTTVLNGTRLRDMLTEAIGHDTDAVMSINVLSFGFKYGVPIEADLVFDVRFLPNPFYIEEFRERTGLDEPVRDYVLTNEVTRVFMDKLSDMLNFLVPSYIDEGKTSLVIAIGCTGGRHRSTAIAEKTASTLGFPHVTVTHRDIEKG